MLNTLTSRPCKGANELCVRPWRTQCRLLIGPADAATAATASATANAMEAGACLLRLCQVLKDTVCCLTCFHIVALHLHRISHVAAEHGQVNAEVFSTRLYSNFAS